MQIWHNVKQSMKKSIKLVLGDVSSLLVYRIVCFVTHFTSSPGTSPNRFLRLASTVILRLLLLILVALGLGSPMFPYFVVPLWLLSC